MARCCQQLTTGKKCSHAARPGGKYCWQHSKAGKKSPKSKSRPACRKRGAAVKRRACSPAKGPAAKKRRTTTGTKLKVAHRVPPPAWGCVITATGPQPQAQTQTQPNPKPPVTRAQYRPTVPVVPTNPGPQPQAQTQTQPNPKPPVIRTQYRPTVPVVPTNPAPATRSGAALATALRTLGNPVAAGSLTGTTGRGPFWATQQQKPTAPIQQEFVTPQPWIPPTSAPEAAMPAQINWPAPGSDQPAPGAEPVPIVTVTKPQMPTYATGESAGINVRLIPIEPLTVVRYDNTIFWKTAGKKCADIVGRCRWPQNLLLPIEGEMRTRLTFAQGELYPELYNHLSMNMRSGLIQDPCSTVRDYMPTDRWLKDQAAYVERMANMVVGSGMVKDEPKGKPYFKNEITFMDCIKLYISDVSDFKRLNLTTTKVNGVVMTVFDKLMRESPAVDRDFYVWRGVRMPLENTEDAQRLLDVIARGETVKPVNSPLSTSASSSVAIRFARMKRSSHGFLYYIKVPKGTRGPLAIGIYSRYGASEVEGNMENEILLPMSATLSFNAAQDIARRLMIERHTLSNQCDDVMMLTIKCTAHTD